MEDVNILPADFGSLLKEIKLSNFAASIMTSQSEIWEKGFKGLITTLKECHSSSLNSWNVNSPAFCWGEGYKEEKYVV